MKNITITLKLFAALFVVVLLSSATNSGNSRQGALLKASDGKSIFVDNECNDCHTINSQSITRNGDLPPGNNPPPDLSDEGNMRTTDWIERWLHRQEELHGKKHLKRWTGNDDDLKTLITWVGQLKVEKAK